MVSDRLQPDWYSSCGDSLSITIVHLLLQTVCSHRLWSDFFEKCSQWHQLIYTCSLPWRLAVNRTLKFPMRLKKMGLLHVSALLYERMTTSVESACHFLIYIMCHDILCDWLTQSGDCVGDWKLSPSPVIAFSEVIKMTSIMLCWLWVSHSGRSTQVLMISLSMELITPAVHTLWNQTSSDNLSFFSL